MVGAEQDGDAINVGSSAAKDVAFGSVSDAIGRSSVVLITSAHLVDLARLLA